MRKLKRRGQKWLGKFLPLFLAAFLVAGLAAVSRLGIFRLKYVNCQLNGLPCPLSLEPFLVNLHGQNLFAVTDSSLKNQLNLLNANFETITINKKLPDTISFFLTGSSPVAFMTKKASDQEAVYLALDNTGVLYSQVTTPDLKLPLILVSAAFPLNLGQSDLSLKLANLIDLLNRYYVNFSEIEYLSPEEVHIKTLPETLAVVDVTGDLPNQITSLQYILASIKIEEDLPLKIDLRFDKPVLTY